MGRSGGARARGAELAAPLLLLCWLCCWPDDASPDASSSGNGKHPQNPAVAHGHGSHAGRWRRRSGASAPADGGGGGAGGLPRRAPAPSAASLHLPSTSGHKQPPSAHRSHEEIPSRRRSHLQPQEEPRYHSAPSVIHEVLHRRDWERSTKDLYIPLKPEVTVKDIDSDTSSPEPPHADPESSSIECLRSEERLNCKKHYANIKSSRNRTKKESTREDIKDVDTTEGSMTNFYIGDAKADSYISSSIQDMINNDVISNDKTVHKAEEGNKRCNESIKAKDRTNEIVKMNATSVSMEGRTVSTFDLDAWVDELDRSGAMHHDPALRFMDRVSASPFPPSSVEAVGYECFLPTSDTFGPSGDAFGASGNALGVFGDTFGASWDAFGGQLEGEGWLHGRVRALAAAERGLRARHASDGDILAPALRPESGAFSESDLDLELESGDERPPPYEELADGDQPSPRRRVPRETAI